LQFRKNFFLDLGVALRLVIYIVLATFSLSGCGYRLASQTYQGDRLISIPVFANKTLRPNLEARLTARILSQFAGSSGNRVVNKEQADLELSGTILTYSESATAFTANDKVAMYQASMTAEALLRQTKTGTVLWKGAVRAVQDYPTSSNIALKINAQESALDELCRKLAESIARESGNSF
jgi:hypothetical protein